MSSFYQPHLRTWHNYDAFEVISAVQKCIRRGLEEDALYWSFEMAKSPNKAHYTWLWQRLKVIASEDVGPASWFAPVLVDVLWRRWKEDKNCNLWFVNAVLYLVRSRKSRIVDNAINAIRGEHELGEMELKPVPEDCKLENMPSYNRGDDKPKPSQIPLPIADTVADKDKLEKADPPAYDNRPVPGFAIDIHTKAGKQHFRDDPVSGKRDFYETSARLVNAPVPDPYEERAKAADLELARRKMNE
jgi:hypothetical protein